MIDSFFFQSDSRFIMIASLRSYAEALPEELTQKPLPFIAASIVVAVVIFYLQVSTASKLPVVNPKGTFEFSNTRTKALWMKDGSKMIREWFAKNPNKPVLANGDMGPIIVLPPSMIQEIRNDPRLGFSEVTQEVRGGHHGTGCLL